MSVEDDVADQRTIGRLEAQMESAEERLDRIETKLDALVETVSQAKGGWKMVVAIASAGGAIGASVVKLFGMLKGGTT